MELFQEQGADSRNLSDELKNESRECDWKPPKGVNWCSGAQCRPPRVEGKGERSSCSWGVAWHNLG